MKSARVQHSKYKNTGILFELLARQVTVDVLNERDNTPALRIMREYFNPSTELGKELTLYRTIFERKKLTEHKASAFLDLVLSQRRRLNTRKLNEEKYRLVKEIKESYPLRDFLSSKIPQYKLYASIYKTFLAESLPHKIDVADVGEVAQARFTLIEQLSTESPDQKKDSALVESIKMQAEDLRLLTYKILVDKFNTKYSTLDERQKVLLRNYINNVANTNSLREYINAEVPTVKNELKARLHRVKDKVVRIKLEEVINQIDTIKRGRIVKDGQVTALMIAYQMVREIDNV